MEPEKEARFLREILNKHCSILAIRELLRYSSQDQTKISEKSGKEKNAISKNLSEIEEITLPTFLRYWEAIEPAKRGLSLDSIYTPEIQKTVKMIILTKDLPNLKDLVLSEKEYFGNKSFQYLIRDKKKFLSKDQQYISEEIIKILEEDRRHE